MTRHLILYDSDCGLCNRLNQFILDHDRKGIFDFASLQSEVGWRVLYSFGVQSDILDTVYLVTDHQSENPHLLDRSSAVLRIAAELGWPWRAAMIFNIFPKSMRDAIYNWIARNRHKFFRDAVCRIHDESTRRRFLDS